MSKCLKRSPQRNTQGRMDDVEAFITSKVAAGERDLMEGGVPTPAIAEGLGITKDAARGSVSRLIANGSLVRVWGSNPETLAPRASYLPADHPDVTEDWP